MYGQRHPLAYQSTQSEKLVWNFSARQAAWLLAGGFLSFWMIRAVPPLPFESIVFKHVHHLIPFAACALFGYGREGKTGLPLFRYCSYWVQFHRRKKILLYKRR